MVDEVLKMIRDDQMKYLSISTEQRSKLPLHLQRIYIKQISSVLDARNDFAHSEIFNSCSYAAVFSDKPISKILLESKRQS
jgi:hypothetical protein